MKGTEKWLRITIFNLLIVALLGVLMRYKIGFSFPYLDQKHLQHAHSHFAFSGWIAQTLYVLMLHFLSKFKIDKPDRFNWLLVLNIIAAYGMLISFITAGYDPVSIAFATLSIVVAVCFTIFYVRELKKVSNENMSKHWFIAALVFNVLSSLGTFALAYFMMTRGINQDYYLASLYFYLHFQYNGFFLFTCFGLMTSVLPENISHSPKMKTVFRLFAIACVPAYFLSTLWMKLPIWLYVLVVIAAFAQAVGWLLFIKNIWPAAKKLKGYLSKTASWLFTLVAVSFTAKILLQLGSTIPAVSKLAFGFRNIVIAYLHLILLAVITVFLLSFIFNFVWDKTSKVLQTGLWMFVAGVYLNELVLGIIGIASFTYTGVPFANELLFGVSVLMMLGLTLLLGRKKLT